MEGKFFEPLMSHSQSIPVLDLFAGPGGLGEGFSSLRKGGEPVFKIALSVEMNPLAHQTLTLRSFIRQFPEGPPAEYYDFLKQDKLSLDELFSHHKREARAARLEAWNATLGETPHEEVKSRMTDAAKRRKDSPLVLIGGPPCQAYSLVGRARMLPVQGAEFYADRRHTLYEEYLRILRDHSPDVFVMENVKGMLSAVTVDGESVFERIRDDLANPKNGLSYRLFSLWGDGDSPKDFVVRAEELGIPQARHRVIIIGVKQSIADKVSGAFLKRGESAEEVVTAWDVLSDLPQIRSCRSDDDSREAWRAAFNDAASSKWLKSLRRSDPVLESRIRETCLNITVNRDVGGAWVRASNRPHHSGIADWLLDSKLDGVCNHHSRSHRADDLHRYLFVSSHAAVHGYSPKLENFPSELLPAHKNVQRALEVGVFNDRFRVLLRNRPSTTITAHMAKDGHAFIHPDPGQCRSLTVREAARLQTFPDNYRFMGPRTEQFRQVGNAVPPLLAKKIAEVVRRILELAR